LKAGGFALVPPASSFHARASAPASLLLLRKRYEPAPGVPLYTPLTGNQETVPGTVYMGDPGALLQCLVPDEIPYDLAMNIFTFEVGHSLPVTETHVMEHGLVVLQGKGTYFLDDTWMEVEATDFIWMGPYCPQSYYATGLVPSKYIYYKNVNREIPL
jgi:(S)-ureidoglycine aminohydrolase